MQKIEVLMDTKIIENNTADAVQVKLIEEKPITEYVSGDTTVKGENLVVESTSYANQGNLKAKIAYIDEQIVSLQASKDEAEAMLALISPEIDKAIVEVLKDPTAEDRRTLPEVM